MINLNSLNYNSFENLKDLILSNYDDEFLFKFYLGNFTIGKPFSSPFRTDKHPSFAIFISNDGKLLYHEMLYKEIGDVFKLVKNLYNLQTYEQAFIKIINDLSLNTKDNFIISKQKQYKKKQYIPKKIKIGVKYRKWNNNDKLYWQQFNINLKTLKKYNVRPISFIFYNDIPLKVDKYAYSFKEEKDSIITFKIYQPYNTKFKWLNNHNSSVWQGWTQLPNNNNNLIITSSLKDVMSIINTTNIPSVALQAETTNPKPKIIKELKNRFKNIYIFYDNDFNKEINWGQKYAKELCENFNLINLKIPTKYQSKDFSDLIKNKNKNIAKQWLISTIKEKL